jgi:hypothetical protein
MVGMGMRKRLALGGFTVAIFVACSSVGCGSSSEEEEAAAAAGSDRAFETTIGASGSRLRARFLGAGDAKLLIGFRDTERNEDCTFQPAETGKIRCLPESFPVLTGPNFLTFSDAACQNGVLLGNLPTCTDVNVKYAIRTIQTFTPGCSGNTLNVAEIRKRDASVPPTIFSNTNNGGPAGSTCTPQLAPANNGQPITTTPAAFTEVVPWTAFVEATETPTPRDGGAIIERVLVAADGARQHLGYRAPIDGGQDCSFHVMADGITRCVPDKGRTGPVAYGDSACQKPLFVRDFSSVNRNNNNNSNCPDSSANSTTSGKLWIEPSSNICGGIGAVYTLGDTFSSDTSTVFAWSSSTSTPPGGVPTTTTTCRLDSVNPPIASQGARPIAANVTGSLPSSRRWRNGGRGARLVPALVPQPGVTRGPDGSENMLHEGFHDSERDVDCTFELATDGKIHCLPVAASAVVFNTDEECKSAGVVAVFSSSPCVATTKFARVVIPGTCPAVTKIYALGTASRDVPNVSTRVTADDCARVQSVIGAVDATEVDPTQFVEGAATTE